MSHIPVIDFLRGLAACSVCLFHFVYTTKDFITGAMSLSVFRWGYYGVHLFFVISGMVIPLSMIRGDYNYKAWPKFIWKRFIRIEPPYIAAVLIGTAFIVMHNHLPGSLSHVQIPSVQTLLLHLGYLVPFQHSGTWISPVFWTLAIEFQYYLVLSLLFPLALSSAWAARVAFYMVFIGGCFCSDSFHFVPAWMPLFLLGIMYVLWHSGKVSLIEYAIVTIAAMILVYWKIDGASLWVAMGTLAIVHFFKNYSDPISKFFGNISYSLYLLHAIVGSAFVNYFSHRVQYGWQKGMIVIGGFLVSVTSAYLLNKFIEKPAQRLSSKVKYGTIPAK